MLKRYKELSRPLKTTIGYTLSNVMQKGIMFLAIPIYTRILTTQQYGRYSVFLAWIDIFEIITTFRISWGGYVVGLNKYSEDKDRYTSALQCLSIVITSCFFLMYLICRETVNGVTDMSTEVTVMIFCIMYFIPAMKFWTMRERVEYRYKKVLLVTTLMSFFTVLLGTWGALKIEEKDIAVIGAKVIVQALIGFFLIIKNCSKKFVFFHKEYWERTLKFNIPLITYYLSMVILNSSDRIVIKQLIGETEAGIYSVAYTASMFTLLFSTSLNGVLQPWLYKRMKENDTDGVSYVINFSLLLVSLINLVVIIFAPEIVMILAPKQYHEAIWVIPPLAASVNVMFFYQHFVNIEFYFEESKLTSIASIGAAILNLALNYYLIPLYGYLAAGYTTLISYLLFGIVHYCFMRYVCKKNDYSQKLIDINSMIKILLLFFIVSLIILVGYQVRTVRGIVLIVIACALIVRWKEIKISVKKFMELF